MRVRVCIPYYAEYDSCLKGIAELEACTEHEFVIEPRRGTYIGKVRNSLINDLKSSKKWQDPVPGFDAFLTIDSDISFTLDDVLQLIARDRPIVAAPYLKHNQDLYECGSINEVTGSLENHAPGIRGAVPIDWIGAGFMLIKAEVFTKTEYPWYRHPMMGFTRDGIDYQEEYWEDVGFCVNARENGFDTWCDFNIKILHNNRTTPNINQEKQMPTNNQQKQGIPQSLSEMVERITGTTLDMNTVYKAAIQEISGLQQMVADKDKKIAELEAKLKEKLKKKKR